MASCNGEQAERAGPASSQLPPRNPILEDDSDDDDPFAAYSRDQAVPEDDPLNHRRDEAVSFKRKQKAPVGSGTRFLSALTGNASNRRHGATSPNANTPTLNLSLLQSPNTLGGGREGSSNDAGAKDASDWYVEVPGRRVGYEDMTAIDWIFEYTKERQRLRVLYSSASGIMGYIRQFLDASQIWLLLILTGLAAGTIAAGIDVASDWLGDLKTGYCSSRVDGGRFYLNRYFCCYGYDELAKCQDWVPWSLALHITSAGGKWVLEYFFFIMFSVSFAAIASVLVKEFALYAKHSGIPEMKTVLGGFVIRRFMGTWTLVIKSLGLVGQYLKMHRTSC